MVKSIILIYGLGAAIVFCIMICVGLNKYFKSEGITLSEIVQGFFFIAMSWSFFIVCLFAIVLGVLEKMKIEDKVIINGKKYGREDYQC